MRAWYENFFDAVALDFWDKIVPAGITHQEISLLDQELMRPGVARILDVLCGYGRHALPLARRGYQVTGVDISAVAVREIRRRAELENLAVNVIKTDVLKGEMGRDYDGGYCLGNSFSYFDAVQSADFFRRVARALKRGGRFILSTGTAAECLLPNYIETDNMTAGDITMYIEDRYDAEEGILITRYEFVRGGMKTIKTSKHYVFTVSEIRRMLLAAGLRPCRFFGSPAGEEFKLGSPQLYIIAEKTKP